MSVVADEGDDLDAFFDEVSEVEATVSSTVQASDVDDSANCISNDSYNIYKTPNSITNNDCNKNDKLVQNVDHDWRKSLKRDQESLACLPENSSGEEQNVEDGYKEEDIPSKRMKLLAATGGPSITVTTPTQYRRVVVASASVRPATTITAASSGSAGVASIVNTKSNEIGNHSQQQKLVGPSYFSNNSFLHPVLPPPPPPPPPPPALPSAPLLVNTSGFGIPVSENTNSALTNKSKNSGVVRTAAGKVWVDHSLADWPKDDFRLFVGNLDPAVTDQQLFQHFASKYASVTLSKIVRDPTKKLHSSNLNNNNNTNNLGATIFSHQQQQQQQQPQGVSKGYGFISFTNALECAKALREMDQTWLGSRPIRVKRSHWKDRDFKERKKKEEKNLKQRKRLGLL